MKSFVIPSSHPLISSSHILVNMRKERRRGSVTREYKGDYLDFTYNKLVLGLLTIVGGKEKVLFGRDMDHGSC